MAGDTIGDYVDLPRSAVVVRFRPTLPEAVLASAEKEHRRTGGRYGVSVFADVALEGESWEDVVGRLLASAGLMLDPAKNKNVYVCVNAGEILDLNFRFYKDDDIDEPHEHYSVDLGPEPTVIDAERFVAAFPEVVQWL